MLAALLAAGLLPTIVGRDFEVRDGITGEVRHGQRSVPYQPETACYEWVLKVKPEARVLTLRETFTAPAQARWGTIPGDGSTVAADGTSAVTTIEDDLSDGEIRHGWCVAHDDPPGRYRIMLSVGDRELARFEFVQLPNPDTI